jgi:hypothetical protein
VKIQSLRKIGLILMKLEISEVRNFTMKCMLVGKRYYFINIKPVFLKLWNFTNLNMVFPVVILVFDFNESSEGVLHGH